MPQNENSEKGRKNGLNVGDACGRVVDSNAEKATNASREGIISGMPLYEALNGRIKKTPTTAPTNTTLMIHQDAFSEAPASTEDNKNVVE